MSTYKIDNKTFYKKNTLSETYQEIVMYLNELSSIIVEKNGIPLDENEVKQRLETEESPVFYTKLILNHENDVTSEVIDFSEQLLIKVGSLRFDKKNEILNNFTELSTTLLELSNVDEYFSFNVINKNEIKKIVKEAEMHINNQDYSSIIDIIELTFTEWIEDFVEKLKDRKEKF